MPYFLENEKNTIKSNSNQEHVEHQYIYRIVSIFGDNVEIAKIA